MVRRATPFLLLLAMASCGSGADEPVRAVFSVEKIFTFLLLTLGPAAATRPFVAKTQGLDARLKREIAVRAVVYAALGVLAAATIGVLMLRKWNISIDALQFSASLILFWFALRQVMSWYAPQEPKPAAHATTREPIAPSTLAFSLAFPTIATPYGIAVLILLLSVYPGMAKAVTVLGLAGIVLAIDLVAMLGAESLLGRPKVILALRIVGVVLGVLMVAAGVEAGFQALRPLLGGTAISGR